MSVFKMPLSQVFPETAASQLTRLGVALLGRLKDIDRESIGSVVADTLTTISQVTQASRVRLIEFTGSGSVARTHASAVSATRSGESGRTALPEGWLIERLLRGDVVAISTPDDLPAEAVALREQARRLEAIRILGIPASVDSRSSCALVIESTPVGRPWHVPLIEHFQILTGIIAAALQRGRSEALSPVEAAAVGRCARLEADCEYLTEEIKDQHHFDDIIGDSGPLRVALARLVQVAPTTATALLLGPTGSGKELFARALHARSRRSARPLVRVNCAALPPTLVESELFGHEKGAFTGAIAARQGRFELAEGGTIFLDEIGDLGLDVQVKLLRVLQEREFERVGSSRTRQVDVRVIAATHQDLETAVAEGRFRPDLYYRLSVYPILLPSLQERRQDIPQLVWFFIHRHQRALGRRITQVPPSVMDALQEYPWPGNVRELENVVERAMIASTGSTLQLDAPLALSGRGIVRAGWSDNLAAVQRAHIEAVLERCAWRINGVGNAAERLGIHPNTLRFRMKKLGVVCPDAATRHPRPAVVRTGEATCP